MATLLDVLRPQGGNLAYDIAKRALDLAVGTALLIVMSPVMILVAVGIKCSSRGPVLYRQERVGRGGRHFRIYKFRTMLAEAEASGPQITSAGDSRVTVLGGVLRRTKLDEVPQLLNVVRGNMSLVGPRPQVPRFVARFPDGYRDTVLSVRPGMTGPAQLHFRREEDMLEGHEDPERYYVDELLPIKCRIDADYVAGRSLAHDARIAVATALLFLRGNSRKVGRLCVTVRRHIGPGGRGTGDHAGGRPER